MPQPLVTGHWSFVIPRRRRRGGFALLITVTLLAFLVLLLVSLASLTRVETQVAANSQSLAQARQNALLALNIAIGQLQKTTGPDQRVTASADIVLPSSATITGPTYSLTTGTYTNSGTTGAQALTTVNGYWDDPANPRNRHWTGAWKNGNTAAYDRDSPAGFNPQPALQAWLVSGNENAPAGDTYKPTDAVTGLTPASTPLDDIKDTAGRSYRLLLKASAGVTTGVDLDRAVTAPLVTLSSTSVPGTGGASTPVGHYAWWVGDEGVKARANLVDPYAAAPSGESAAQKLVRETTRLQSAQRPAIEAMTTDGTDGLAPLDPTRQTTSTDLAKFDANLLKTVTQTQLAYVTSDATLPTELKTRYHDLSVFSRGVLADTKHGGLKRDLSYILSRPDLSSFRSALNTTGYDVAPDNTWNPALSSASTPYATIPSDPTYSGNPGILQYTATWEQLWSFYNLKEPPPLGVFPAGSDTASARLASPVQHGLTPLLVQAKLFYGMQVTGSAIVLRITPVVVLANPYSVPLSGKFLVKFEKPSPYVVSGKLEDPSLPLVYAASNPNGSKTPADSGYTYNVFTPVANGTLTNGGLGNVYVSITAVIPPGVAQIFTVDPSAPKTAIHSKTDAFEVPMINTYDPSSYITYDTGLTLKPGDTHASFYASGIVPVLYMNNMTDEPNRADYIGAKSPPSSSGAPVEFGFVIYPMTAGYQNGGGVFCALNDGKSNPQQDMFYQVNYRGLTVDYIGSSSYGDHPLQWGVSYGAISTTANTAESAYNPFMSANLLPPPEESIPATTRWGLVSSGEYPSLNTPPLELTDARTALVNILYDIPTPDHPLTSLGQLEHLNLAGYLITGTTTSTAVRLNAFQDNYPVSNSYPAPRVRRENVYHYSSPFSRHYDGSYLWNDLLWDRFTLSSFPSSGNFDFANPDDRLVNARYRPWRDTASVAWDDPAAFRGTYKPAENLLVDGAFNINSTSVEAWKALFSSLKNIPVGTVTAPDAPFARTLGTTAGSANAANGLSSDAWAGFRDLTATEIQKLAEEMVLQVRLRGPFLSLSEFVNRRLVAGPSGASGNVISPADTPDPYRLGLSGALQSAIDKVVNLATNVPSSPYNTPTKRVETTGPRDGTGVFKGLYFADLEYRMPTRIAGYPGYLLQGDVLSALGPTLAARSDTFTVRTYGDAVNPATGTVEGRAWCEAVVQRTPDYVTPKTSGGDDPDETPAAGSTNDTFGRRYQIVSFRWLGPSDI